MKSAYAPFSSHTKYFTGKHKLVIATVKWSNLLIMVDTWRILHECSCFIEFIKRVVEKR